MNAVKVIALIAVLFLTFGYKTKEPLAPPDNQWRNGVVHAATSKDADYYINLRQKNLVYVREHKREVRALHREFRARGRSLAGLSGKEHQDQIEYARELKPKIREALARIEKAKQNISEIDSKIESLGYRRNKM